MHKTVRDNKRVASLS